MTTLLYRPYVVESPYVWLLKVDESQRESDWYRLYTASEETVAKFCVQALSALSADQSRASKDPPLYPTLVTCLQLSQRPSTSPPLLYFSV